MPTQENPEAVIFLCRNCFPATAFKPVQWTEAGVHIRVKEIPCSGKIEIPYIMHALESGMQGVCVLTCPQGECTLSQGNYRAAMRVHTVQKLLTEIGSDPERVQIIHCSKDETVENLKERINGAVQRFSSLVQV
jgi:F420-non-reducing hydrogenase iron-sulfur subunit